MDIQWTLPKLKEFFLQIYYYNKAYRMKTMKDLSIKCIRLYSISAIVTKLQSFEWSYIRNYIGRRIGQIESSQ